MTDEKSDILALYGVPGIGAKLFARLTARFGSAGAVFASPDRELREVNGVGDKLILSIREFDRTGFVREQMRRMERCGATMIIRSDPDYPPLLNRFVSAPRAKRPLFAVPGNADSSASEGANDLLSRGALPVSRIEQVLSRLGRPAPITASETKSLQPRKPELPPLPGMAGDIMTALDRGPLQIEALCARLGEPVHKVLTELTILEMDGYIRQKPGKMFEKMC